MASRCVRRAAPGRFEASPLEGTRAETAPLRLVGCLGFIEAAAQVARGGEGRNVDAAPEPEESPAPDPATRPGTPEALLEEEAVPAPPSPDLLGSGADPVEDVQPPLDPVPIVPPPPSPTLSHCSTGSDAMDVSTQLGVLFPPLAGEDSLSLPPSPTVDPDLEILEDTPAPLPMEPDPELLEDALPLDGSGASDRGSETGPGDASGEASPLFCLGDMSSDERDVLEAADDVASSGYEADSDDESASSQIGPRLDERPHSCPGCHVFLTTGHDNQLYHYRPDGNWYPCCRYALIEWPS